MTLPVTITCAPCCWGVDDVSNPHLPHWERVLDEAAEAGFGGLELGPYGYMPLDVAAGRSRARSTRAQDRGGHDLRRPGKPGRTDRTCCARAREICGLITIAAAPRKLIPANASLRRTSL